MNLFTLSPDVSRGTIKYSFLVMFHVEHSDKTEFCVKHFSFALEKFDLYVIMYILMNIR